MDIHIGLPQAIVILLMILDLIIHTVKAGQPRDPYNPAWNLVNSLIVLALLIWGGFFN